MMDSTLKAALEGQFLRLFVAVRIELKDRTIRLIDGSGEVTFAVNGVNETFFNQDEKYGSFSNLSELEEDLSTSIPHVKLTLLPDTPSSIADLASPFNQRSVAQIWIGLFNDQTGQIVAQPYLAFKGIVDQTTVRAGQSTLAVELDLVNFCMVGTIMNESHRLNLTYQQSIYPSENGLSFVSSNDDVVYWGVDSGNAAAFTFVKTNRTSTGARAASI